MQGIRMEQQTAYLASEIYTFGNPGFFLELYVYSTLGVCSWQTDGQGLSWE